MLKFPSFAFKDSKALLILAGLLIAMLIYFGLPNVYIGIDELPRFLTPQAKLSLAIAFLMGFWWCTTPIPLAVTALLPIVLFPLAQVSPSNHILEYYFTDNAILVLSSYILAVGIRESGLGKRLMLHFMCAFGAEGHSLIRFFLMLSAALSIWMANSTVVLFLLPLVRGVLYQVEKGGWIRSGIRDSGFSSALLLSICFGAAIGGLATILGSQPNAFFSHTVRSIYGTRFSHSDWLIIGTSLALILLPAAYWILAHKIYVENSYRSPVSFERIFQLAASTPPMSRFEKLTAFFPALAVVLWACRPLRSDLNFEILAFYDWMSNANIGLTCAALLCIFKESSKGNLFGGVILRASGSTPLLILLILGAGSALAGLLSQHEVGYFLISELERLAGLPLFFLLLAISSFTLVLTNFMPNTQLAYYLIPAIAASVPLTGEHAEIVLLAVTLSVSCAFITPVGTPGNTIVFGSDLIPYKAMSKAGAMLSVFSIFAISLFCTCLIDFF